MMSAAPMTGVHVALAFGTLLSSQGADAHRQEALASIWGNPANLPFFVKSVKRFGQESCLRVLHSTPAHGLGVPAGEALRP